jgi:GDP-L-fucose synthase
MLAQNDKILVAGARGMVGSALVSRLHALGFHALLTPSHIELDCTNQAAVRDYLKKHKPTVVVVTAAKVGGIWANMTQPAEFIYENMMIGSNLIHESHTANVPRLLYLGSTCIYPRETTQPITEEALLTGPLEKTNEAYALAKIACIKMCQFYRAQYGRSYISAMPTNLYGPGDNYHPTHSHVIPGLLRRFHEAKINGTNVVEIWGTGQAQREFLYVEDLACALVHLLQHYDEEGHINIGHTEEVTIKQLAEQIAQTVNYRGVMIQNQSKPDGIPRKKTDISRILALGWKPTVSLTEGLAYTYQSFLKEMSVQAVS